MYGERWVNDGTRDTDINSNNLNDDTELYNTLEESFLAIHASPMKRPLVLSLVLIGIFTPITSWPYPLFTRVQATRYPVQEQCN